MGIYQDSSNNPGTQVGSDLTLQGTFGAGNNTFNASGITLHGGTTYHVVVKASGSGTRTLRQTTSNAESGSTGWGIADTGRATTDSGSTWSDITGGHSLKFTVNATSRTVVWSGTLTVDRVVRNIIPIYGCDNGLTGFDDCSSALTDDDFTYGGTDFEIESIFILDQSTDTMGILLDTAWPSTIRASGTLSVGANTLNFSSATIDEDNKRAKWTNPGFTWTDNQSVSLSITVPTPDTTAPTVSTATVDGSTLVIDFDENLAAAPGLSNTDFTVKVGGGSGVTLSGSPSIGTGNNADKLTLTLQTAVTSTSSAVTVSYAKPTTGSNNKLKDAADNEVASFTDIPVINNTGRTTVWSATLTVDQATSGAIDYYGCDNTDANQDSCSSNTVLTDDDFTYGGTTFTIRTLYLRAGATPTLALLLDAAWLSAIQTNGRLNAGANTFNLSSATLEDSNRRATWSNPGFTWADDQVVQLSLTMPQADTTAPTVITNGYSPTDNAMNVAKNTNLVLTFSEAVQAGTGNIIIKNTGNNADTRRIPVGDSQVSFGGTGANLNRIVTINPTNDLTDGASYAVNIANGVITDRASPTPNSYAGIGNDTTWNFSIAASAVRLSTSNLRQTTATLSISGHSAAWWYKRTSPTAGSCESRSAGQKASLSSLSANTRYTYKAYSATGCMDANEIASLTFITRLPSQKPLTYSAVTNTGATLTLTGYTADWWYRQIGPTMGACTSVAAGTTSVNLTGLSANTAYIYGAFRAAGCAWWTISDIKQFQTTGSALKELTASSVTATGATLNISNLTGHTGAWYLRGVNQQQPYDGTTCTMVTAGSTSGSVSGLRPDKLYAFHGYASSDCTITRLTTTAWFWTSASTNGTDGQSDPVTPASASLTVTPTTVNEGSPVTVKVTLSKSLAEAVNVPVKVTTGTSESGDHGTLTSVTVSAGKTTGSVGITTSQDTDRDDETFTVALDTDKFPSTLTAGNATSVTVTITDTTPEGETPATPPVVFPDAPTGLAAEAGDSQVKLTWNAYAAAGGWEYSSDGGSNWNTATGAGGSATTYTVTGLDNGTEYTFKVRATGIVAIIKGTASDSVTATPALQTQNNTATPTVSLSADSSVDEGGEATVTATLSAALEANVSIPLTLTDGTAESGDYGTLASITITAGQTSGTGKVAANWDSDHDADTFTVALDTGNLPSTVTAGDTTSATITINEVGVPAEVANITVTHNGASLTVRWDAAARATGYDITYYNTTDSVNARGAWNHSGTTLTITCDSRPDYSGQNCVESGDTYNVGIRAKNANGESHWRNSAEASYTPPAANEAPAFTSGATFNAAENQTAVGTVVAADSDAADSITGYALTGGADQSKFAITNAGVLTFSSAPDFENPGDAQSADPANAANNNEYVVVVTATGGADGRALTADQTITVTVQDANEAPGFTSGASKSVEENQTAVLTVTAADEDSAETTVTFALQGGADQGKFAITSAGVLTFSSAPDFENPGDVLSTTPANDAGNNQYVVTVRATSGTGDRQKTADQTIVVTVTDVNEAPPEPVTNISVRHDGSSLYVTWDASVGATGYDVTYTNAADNSTGRGAWDYTGTTLTITCDIRAGYENQHCVNGDDPFRVGVRAKNAHGESYWRNSPDISP